MIDPLGLYVALGLLLVVSISIDFFGHTKGKEMSFKESVLWSVFWVAMGIGLGGYIYFDYGAIAASQYFAGYAMEKALSVDNLMVFMAIFTYFGIKDSDREHKILLWGIAGALVFRAIFVALGSEIFHSFWWVEILFGLLVIYSAKPILFPQDDDEETDYGKTWYVSAIKKVYPVDTRPGLGSFFTRINGKRHITPLLLCLVTIELSDIIFSFDSVPAVIGVTKDPALIYSAMIMAVLGLRALFFVLGSLMKHLTRLDLFVGLILVFIGVKLVISYWVSIDAIHSLVAVLSLLALGVITSWVFPKKLD